MLRVASMVLFAMVAFVAATMAHKTLFAQRLLPFHQTATGRGADTFTPSEQSVAVALTRSLGLGFAVVTISLLAAVGTEVAQERWGMVSGSGTALAFCAGLAVINRRLALATSVEEPWKAAVYAGATIAVGLALGMV